MGSINEAAGDGGREVVNGQSSASISGPRTLTHTFLRRSVPRRGLMEGTETATEGINKGVKYGDGRKPGVKIKAEEAEGWRTG